MSYIICKDCFGTGKNAGLIMGEDGKDFHDECPTCKGEGTVWKERTPQEQRDRNCLGQSAGQVFFGD